MIKPSALNLVIVFLMMIIATFLWRMLCARLSESGSPFGEAGAVAL